MHIKIITLYLCHILLYIFFFCEDGYLSLSACYLPTYFYSIWFNFYKIWYSIIGFHILEMMIWRWGMISHLLFSQESVALGSDPWHVGFLKPAPFSLLQATPRAENMSPFISAFPTAYGPFSDTQWVQMLIKYLTKVSKKKS